MRIAVVDDDESVIEFASSVLEQAGHQCVSYRTGSALLAALRRENFDLLLLDWNLPDTTGLDLLHSARGSMDAAVPVIMLTSRSDKDDIARALHAGADDYIVKPESAVVVAARVGAVLRRATATLARERVTHFGAYRFDRLTGQVAIADEQIQLSAKEFQLALVFFENAHRALSRGYLLEKVWQSLPDLPTRTLDVHVSRIRAKLRLIPENGYRILTISGYGYRMESFDEGGTA